MIRFRHSSASEAAHTMMRSSITSARGALCDARLEGVDDPDVLALAAREDRIVVTSDLRTMPGHFGDFLDAHGHCPGVFLVKR
jgi:hypothetical protein